MTLLGFLAACTNRIKLGSTVVILPYRNPVVQAKMFASLDVLTGGPIICGVGVGWLEKEFEILGRDYHQRGAMTDEWLEIMQALWGQPNPEYKGKFYSIDGIHFEPKPIQQPSIPVWVGGHTKAALRRTAKYGACWHTTRQTPEFVAENIPYLRDQVEKAGRHQSGSHGFIKTQPILHRHGYGRSRIRTKRWLSDNFHAGSNRRPLLLP
ncbi:MAG: hypothetical protein CM1200mP27_07410 [Chloroflexota bacterium]|nr:MAG: hypothetical protein CM1200mP27_07410 [Chloroflexota bacterium]